MGRLNREGKLKINSDAPCNETTGGDQVAPPNWVSYLRKCLSRGLLANCSGSGEEFSSRMELFIVFPKMERVKGRERGRGRPVGASRGERETRLFRKPATADRFGAADGCILLLLLRHHTAYGVIFARLPLSAGPASLQKSFQYIRLPSVSGPRSQLQFPAPQQLPVALYLLTKLLRKVIYRLLSGKVIHWR